MQKILINANKFAIMYNQACFVQLLGSLHYN